MIFYFSATGNSMYAARQIEENLISIPQAIHNDCQEYTAESIGIVAPDLQFRKSILMHDIVMNTFHCRTL